MNGVARVRVRERGAGGVLYARRRRLLPWPAWMASTVPVCTGKEMEGGLGWKGVGLAQGGGRGDGPWWGGRFLFISFSFCCCSILFFYIFLFNTFIFL